MRLRFNFVNGAEDMIETILLSSLNISDLCLKFLMAMFVVLICVCLFNILKQLTVFLKHLTLNLNY